MEDKDIKDEDMEEDEIITVLKQILDYNKSMFKELREMKCRMVDNQGGN